MKYLGSGPPELYSQFHPKAELLSSLGTRIVPGVTLFREVVRGVCAPEPECPGPALGPAVPRCDCAGWFMTARQRPRLLTGIVALLRRRAVEWIKGIDTCEMLNTVHDECCYFNTKYRSWQKEAVCHVTG